MPRRVFLIAECRLDITVNRDSSVGLTAPGGNMLNAALMLARAGVATTLVGECGADPAGDSIIAELESAGVDTSCIDRFPDGSTTLDLHFGPDDQVGTFYTRQPNERLVMKWPRINPGDIVGFGNWLALNPRTAPAVSELVEHAASRGAFTVYMPGYALQLQPAITHVMPQILDYLEKVSMVVTFADDHRSLFGSPTPDDCFDRRLSFYVPAYASIAPDGSATLFTTDGRQTARWTQPADAAGAAARLASMLATVADADAEASPRELINSLKKSWKAIR